MKIYWAGPLFTRAEKDFNATMAAELRKHGLEVILPQEASSHLEMDDTFFKKAFDSCISGIDEADIVVAVVDGPDADSGTCFEIGYAYANKKPVFAVRTDLRALEEMGVNLMISQSARYIFHNIDMTTAELAVEIVRGIGGETLIKA